MNPSTFHRNFAVVLTVLSLCTLPLLAAPKSKEAPVKEVKPAKAPERDTIDEILADTKTTTLAKLAYPTEKPLTLKSPTTLTLKDLADRPERWPVQVAMKTAKTFVKGGGLYKGQQVIVTQFDGKQITAETEDTIFTLSPKDCDFLEAANKIWGALTPAQRAVDFKLLASDVSLWPLSVRLSQKVEFGNNTLYAGNEFDIVSVGAENIIIWVQNPLTQLTINLQSSDVMERARERMLLDVNKRPSRVAHAVKNILIDSEGKQAKQNFDNTNLYLLYYGASWCPPCRMLAPQLVKYVSGISDKNPAFSVIFVDNDQEQENMLAYMQDNKMPWYGVTNEASGKSSYLNIHDGTSIPRLVVVDRHGTILADTHKGEEYLGPEHALRELNKMLNSGWGK